MFAILGWVVWKISEISRYVQEFIVERLKALLDLHLSWYNDFLLTDALFSILFYRVPASMEGKVDQQQPVSNGGGDHPAEMSEEQRKRLEKIKARNLEQLTYDQMNR